MNKNERKKDDSLKKSIIFSFSLIGQVGFATALPLVFFSLLGRYLDNKLGTTPYLLLAGLCLATIIVYFTLRKIVQQAIKEFNNN